MYEYGIPEDTCQQYKARDDVCDADNVCRNCAPPPPPEADTCWPVPDDKYTLHYITEYGRVRGEKAMRHEIFARGPIACEIDSGPLESYEGGVLEMPPDYEPTINHIISVAGWGETEEGQKYWIVRNSWGTYWGEGGWFRIRRGTNELFIEENCHWVSHASERPLRRYAAAPFLPSSPFLLSFLVQILTRFSLRRPCLRPTQAGIATTPKCARRGRRSDDESAGVACVGGWMMDCTTNMRERR